MKIIEWLVPLILGVTTLVSMLSGGLHTAIVTGTCAGFTLGLAFARLMFRQV